MKLVFVIECDTIFRTMAASDPYKDRDEREAIRKKKQKETDELCSTMKSDTEFYKGLTEKNGPPKTGGGCVVLICAGTLGAGAVAIACYKWLA